MSWHELWEKTVKPCARNFRLEWSCRRPRCCTVQRRRSRWTVSPVSPSEPQVRRSCWDNSLVHHLMTQHIPIHSRHAVRLHLPLFKQNVGNPEAKQNVNKQLFNTYKAWMSPCSLLLGITNNNNNNKKWWKNFDKSPSLVTLMAANGFVRPWRAFSALCHTAKFGQIWCSSFNNTQVKYFVC